MPEYVLTLLDTSGIQDYVFGSNRLQENIGASELVYRATTSWTFAALETAELTHNIINSHRLDWNYDEKKVIENQPDLKAEVIYAGGGNTLILFRSLEMAQAFTRELTRKVLEHAPGLTVVAQHVKMDWGQPIERKRLELFQAINLHKMERLPSTPFLGLGISAVCQSTGKAAVRNNAGTIQIEGKPVRLSLPGEEERLISRETACKIGWRDFANDRLKFWLGDAAGEYDFPHDIDKLGRIKDEESYVAVIHADGNRMGKHVEAAAAQAKTNREWITALRAFSKNIQMASLAALNRTVALVADAVKNKVVPHEKGYLPFRPLVFGGDDVTFLCSGPIGVSLAAAFLDYFEKETAASGLANLHASAGIAIVKMHYPFRRAYELSEQLTNSAKKFVRKEVEADCSALDWHFATGGLSGDLDIIRKREYTVKEGLLVLRPVRLRASPGDQSGRAWWGAVEDAILTFQLGKYWVDRKNKVVGLREPLRNGSNAVQSYRRNFEVRPLPPLASAQARETGWQKDGEENRCIYFDPIELVDHYIPLAPKESIK